jgi:predicted TIM-barrel fold metal-dependent hydrolase
MDRYLVISSDCHAGLPPERYRDYLEAQYHETFDLALPVQEEMTKLMEKQFLVGDINEEWRKGREHLLEGAWNHDRRIEVLDGDGIAAEVIFPDGITERNMPPFGAGISLSTEGVVPELQWAGARAHNRWLAEFVAQEPARRFGVAIVPALWDVDEAVKEVRWAKENGLGGIMLPVMWGKQAPYHHPKYNPLWEVCEDLGVILHFHSGPAPTSDYFGPPPEIGKERTHPTMPGAMGIYISEVIMWNVRPLTFLIWGGIFERYPKLKLSITEGTTIWVPEYLALLDHRYGETHYSAKLGDYQSHLSMKPSDYFARNVRLGASCMPRRETEMRHEIGMKNIMWGSDYPHPEGSWPFTREQITESFIGLPEDDITLMLGGNALAFYGFDEEKLLPIAERVGPTKQSLGSPSAATG